MQPTATSDKALPRWFSESPGSPRRSARTAPRAGTETNPASSRSRHGRRRQLPGPGDARRSGSRPPARRHPASRGRSAPGSAGTERDSVTARRRLTHSDRGHPERGPGRTRRGPDACATKPSTADRVSPSAAATVWGPQLRIHGVAAPDDATGPIMPGFSLRHPRPHVVDLHHAAVTRTTGCSRRAGRSSRRPAG